MDVDMIISDSFLVILGILAFVYPAFWFGALLLWLWRLAKRRDTGRVPLVFVLCLLLHVVGFLHMHADPFFYLDGGGREHIPPLGQFLMGGVAASFYALAFLLVALFIAFIMKNKARLTSPHKGQRP